MNFSALGFKSSSGNARAVFPLLLLAPALFWSTAFSEIAASILVIAALTEFVRRPGTRSSVAALLQAGWWPRAVAGFWIVYVCGLLVSALASKGHAPDPADAGRIWHCLLFPAIVALRVQAPDVRTAGKMFVVSGTAAAILALTNFSITEAARLEALFVGNTTGIDLLTIAGVALLWTAFREFPQADGVDRRKLFPWLAAVAALAIPVFLAVFLSAEKAPILVLLVGSLSIAAANRPRAVPLMGLFLSGLLLLAPRPFWLSVAWVGAGNLVDRYALWKTGLTLTAHLPVAGYGLGSFERILPAATSAMFMSRPPASWHNDALQTLLESGWATCIAYCGFAATLLRSAVASCRRHRDRWTRGPGIILGLLFIVLLSFALVGSVISTAVLGITFWTLAGLLFTFTLEEHVDEVSAAR